MGREREAGVVAGRARNKREAEGPGAPGSAGGCARSWAKPDQAKGTRKGQSSGGAQSLMEAW